MAVAPAFRDVQKRIADATRHRDPEQLLGICRHLERFPNGPGKDHLLLALVHGLYGCAEPDKARELIESLDLTRVASGVGYSLCKVRLMDSGIPLPRAEIIAEARHLARAGQLDTHVSSAVIGRLARHARPAGEKLRVEIAATERLLLDICRDLERFPNGSGKDHLLLAVVHGLYAFGEPDTAQEVFDSLDLARLKPEIGPVLRKGMSVPLTQPEHIAKAWHFARAARSDMHDIRIILQRFAKHISRQQERSKHDVAALLSQNEPWAAATIGNCVQLDTPGASEFAVPQTLNEVAYCVRDQCDQPPYRPQLKLFELSDVVLFKHGSGMAITRQDRPLSGLFNEVGVLQTYLGDWSDTPEVEEKQPSILSLDHFVSPNYCHWLFDSLFRVIALRKAYSAGARDALILIHATAPFITDSVALLGIPADRLRALGERARIRFKRLYVCSSSFWDLRHPAQLGSTEVLLAVRRHLAGRARPAPHRGAVFISRRDASKRRLLNEDELEAALTPLGVTFIAAGGLSLSDQIEIFSGASLIIGAHGAGLANLLFAPPGATVLEIFPPSYGTASFFAASAGLGHRYVCVTGGDGVSRPPPSIRNNFFAREDFVAPVSAIAEFVAAQRLQS